MVKIEVEEKSYEGAPLLTASNWSDIVGSAVAVEAAVTASGVSDTKFGKKYYVEIELNSGETYRVLLNKTSLRQIKKDGIDDTDDIARIRLELVKVTIRGQLKDMIVVTKAYPKQKKGGKK